MVANHPESFLAKRGSFDQRAIQSLPVNQEPEPEQLSRSPLSESDHGHPLAPVQRRDIDEDHFTHEDLDNRRSKQHLKTLDFAKL